MLQVPQLLASLSLKAMVLTMPNQVLATQMERQVLATGPWPGDEVMGVALPCKEALRKRVLVHNPSNGKVVYAEVLDVGPWAINDHSYVFGNERPRAEQYKGRYCPTGKPSDARAVIPDGNGGWIAVERSNGAGIDLFPATAKALGIAKNDNVYVDWSFID